MTFRVCQLFFPLHLILSFCVVVAASAQEPSSSPIPAPKPPFVKTPPPGSVWSMQAVYSTGNASTPASDSVSSSSPTKASVSRLEMRVGTNNISLATMTSAAGQKSSYYVAENRIWTKTNMGSVFALNLTPDADAFDLVSPSFPVVSWLNTKNYTGIEKINSAVYYKFHQPPDSNPAYEGFNPARTAWIRVSDGYPWKVTYDNIVFTFSEIAPFSATIDLPAEYQAALARRAAKERFMEMLRNAPR